MKDFFVTLLSNSSMNYFPQNKTSSFTVQLAEKITLNGSWNVGIAEIHYNYNFFNVTDANNEIIVKRKSDQTENSIVPMAEIRITPGYYSTVSDLVETVNTTILDRGLINEAIISIDGINNRTIVHAENVYEKLGSVTFKGRLAMQLGFEPGANILDFRLSPHIGNTSFGVPDQMLIYTDIIEPTYIGHEKASVLKIINTNVKSYKFGDVCYKEYTHIHYMPVQKREFEAVSVDIRDYTGTFMPFQHGVLTIKLHFKKNGPQ